MKLLKILGENFRSFEKIEWTPPTSGLMLLDGKNLDTGGSNMSGKSSLLDSVFWALYGWLPRWEGPKGGPVDAVIRRGSKRCFVSVEIQVGQDKIVVYRQRGPANLTVTVNDKEIQGKSDELQKEIDRRIMTSARFLASVYASQDRRTSFFTMGDAERTELLSIVAGLEALDTALAASKAERDALDKELIGLKAKLESQESRIAEFPSLIEEAKKDLEDNFVKVDSFKLKLQSVELAAQQEIAEATQKYEQRVKEIEQGSQEQVVKLNSAIEALAKTYHSIRSKIDDTPKPEPELVSAVQKAYQALQDAIAFNQSVDKIVRENEKIKDKIERLMEEADSHMQGSCRACGQELPQWSREKSAQEKIEQAKQLDLQIKPIPDRMVEDGQDLRRAEAALEARKAELAVLPNKLRAELTAVEAQLNEAKAKMKALESQAARERGEAVVNLNQVKSRNSERTREAKMMLESAERAAEVSEKTFVRLKEDEDKQKSTLSQIKEDIATKNKRLDQAIDLVELFGPKGYRSVCFDGLVNRIGSRAGQLLSIMTDGNYSTRLDQVGSDSKGNAKMILKPVVTKGGQDVPMDDLSGGARRRVMLAYDISVSEAAGDAAPLFLDEALDGLDVVGKTEAMQLLDEVSKTRPVIVVDHASEMKSAFQNILTVEYKQGLSVLKEGE